VSGRKASEPAFDVWPTRLGAADLAALRGAHAKAAKRAITELGRSGCAAAHYRLSGDGVERICVRRLRDNWRMVLSFPASDEVAIVLVGPHERENPDLDIYMRLYAALGIEVPDAEHRRPACCCDGAPPVHAESFEQILEATKRAAGR
jgi:hypothetical protein